MENIGFIRDDNSDNFEVVTDCGRRLQPEPGAPGIYRQYARKEDAEKAARTLARKLHAAYVGELEP